MSSISASDISSPKFRT